MNKINKHEQMNKVNVPSIKGILKEVCVITYACWQDK